MFAVTWSGAAVQRLAHLEATADDPTRIRTAAQWADYTLRRTPTDMGESRASERFRVWYSDVLGLYFHVDRDAATVRVIDVGLAKRD
ncbi:MAG: hypothetical protein MUF18_09145 [Fimbriiglobus sp.]|nr:hypothetical protein [Fimbriiglobus sp.]